MPEFKFKIGDLVYGKSSVHDCLMAAQISPTAGACRMPFSMMIVGRYLDECSGGAQVNYACSLEGKIFRLHELELMPVEDWDIRAYLEAFEASRKTASK